MCDDGGAGMTVTGGGAGDTGALHGCRIKDHEVAFLWSGDGFDHDVCVVLSRIVSRHVPDAMDTTLLRKATAEVSRSRRVRKEGSFLCAFDPPQPTKHPKSGPSGASFVFGV